MIESEDEEEEVLVDDFDGQCCRTYPYNHSKIQRWREGRKEKKEKERKEGSKHLAHHVQSVKTPTSNPEKSSNKQNEPTSTAAGGNFFIHNSMSLPLKLVAGVKCLCTPLSKQTEVLPRPTKLDEPLGVILRHWSGIVTCLLEAQNCFLDQIGRSCHRLKSD